MYKILAKPFFIGKKVFSMPICHSTNDMAAELLKKDDVVEGAIVIADYQEAGKGQQGNSWEAQPGMNLTFSVILKPKMLALQDNFALNIISSLAILDFIEKKTQCVVKVKWPNDVYVENEKIAGILIQNTVKSLGLETSIVGMGVNINQTDFASPNSTSVKLLSGQQLLLGECLETIILYLEKYYLQLKSGYLEKLHNQYIDHLYWINEIHTFQFNKQHFTGIIRGIDSSGKLHIEAENGPRYFAFKEVMFVR